MVTFCLENFLSSPSLREFKSQEEGSITVIKVHRSNRTKIRIRISGYYSALENIKLRLVDGILTPGLKVGKGKENGKWKANDKKEERKKV